MRWTVKDQVRFAFDLAAFIDRIRDEADVVEQITARLEDELAIFGAPVPTYTVQMVLLNTASRVYTPRLSRLTEDVPESRSLLFAALVSAAVGGIINDADSSARFSELKRRQGEGGR